MKKLVHLFVLLGALAGGALHAEEEGFLDKTGRVVKKGAEATGKGIEKGAEATGRGVNKAVEATSGVARKADAWISGKITKGSSDKDK